MKLLFLGGLLTAALGTTQLSHDAAPLESPSGRYLEARTATVFGGACHINSEALSQGRQALVCWIVESGGWNGVDLAGRTLVAAVSSEANLAHGRGRRTVLHVDAGASPAQARAAREWLTREAGRELGAIVRVETAAMRTEFDGDRFRVQVSERVALVGTALADRSCCTMVEWRWYEPLFPGARETVVVGNSAECRFAGAAGLPAWTYNDANNVFSGSFGAPSE